MALGGVVGGAARALAHARVLDPGVKYPEASIGRAGRRRRGVGLGRAAAVRAIAGPPGLPDGAIRISAQTRLERFYESFGFVAVGAPYLEDGIDHTEMLRDPAAV
jgi:ElaA protein